MPKSMRTLVLLALPSVALAYDSEVVEVAIEARQQLHQGVDYTTYWPSADSALAVKFSADTSTEVAIDMAVGSQLSWPAAITHRWSGVELGGLAQLITDTTLAADIHIDAFGFTRDLRVWDETFEWTAEKWFDSLLMTGHQDLVFLQLEDLHYFAVDVDWQVTEDVLLTFGLDGDPIAEASLTGTSMIANGVETFDATEPAALYAGATNDGEFTVDALWKGHITALWGVSLTPWVRVDITDMGQVELPLYQFRWDLGSDDRDIASKQTAIDHAIPAIDAVNLLDLGTVSVGQTVERELVIENLGDMALVGSATFTGDSDLRLVDRSFNAAGEGRASLTVRFVADEAGDFEGTIRLASNDPVVPSVEIPVIASAVAADDSPDSDPGLDEDGDEFGRIRGCGCSSAGGSGAPAAALGLGLVGLLGLRRRR